jgi:hypothetical protein
MKLIVTGTRSLPPDRQVFVSLKLDRLTEKLKREKLVVLTRKGEGLVLAWCFNLRIACKVFQPDETDEEMLAEADAAIMFKGQKRNMGTELLEKLLKKAKTKMRVIEWKGTK